ncbi:MAG: flagellar export chaperone FliS [Sedimentisphaerales bacterium]|jgi:flagellar protein FliS|nr:flagellar export chaperone FliS [Sedimentisphaerales bacterium]
MQDILEQYRATAITTQSKTKLVVMLYDGAIRFLNMAIREIEGKDFLAKNNHIKRAQDIIWELNNVLNMEVGGQIAQNLRSLYVYMNRRLIEANIKSDPKIIQEVISLLEILNQGWKAIAE